MSILHTDSSGQHHSIHGYIGSVGPRYDRKFFTGSSFNGMKDEAKVYSTKHGLMKAMKWYYDHFKESGEPIPEDLWKTRRAVPVNLWILEDN